jgi:hypothetical protein
MHLSPLASLSIAAVLGFAPLALAQDGIVWPNVDDATDARIVQIAPNSYEVYCDGFMTVSASGKDSPDDVLVGLGVSVGTVRKVDNSQFEDPSDGEEGDDAPATFPFVPNLTTGSGFASDPRGAGLVWSGFQAKTTRPVAPYRRGAFQFRFDNVATRSQLVAALTGAKVAVAKGTSSGAVIPDARLQYVRIRSVQSAEILYYKFDRGGDTLAINHAWPYAGAPNQGTMFSTSSTSPWTSGAFAGGLRAGLASGTVRHGCNVDWNGDVYGSVTIAWWQRMRLQPAPQLPSYFVHGPGKFGIYASAAIGGELRVRDYGRNTPELRFKTNVLALGTQRWTAMALRFDAANSRATLFVDGKSVETVAMPSPVWISTGGSSLVLGGSPLNSALIANIADLDEFRLCAYAASPSEIAAWATEPSARATAYGPQARALLGHRGRVPQLGNSGYELHVRGPGSSAVALWLGSVLTPPFVVAGQPWYSMPALLFSGATNAQGAYALPLPIPNSTSLKGMNLHNQAIVITTGSKLRVSNAHLSSIR